jgi:SSS family solute:Na+ symporter
MAQQLYGAELGKADAAFPVMVTRLVPAGLRGLLYAAIAGAVTSTLASLLNSASTVSTMDVYRRMFRPAAREATLVWLGRALTVVFVVAGCALAPMLDNEKFGGVFRYIQQFQGYIWPGVVAAFIMPFVLPRAPGAAGVAALLTGPAAYAAFQFTAKADGRDWGHGIHYLLQVPLAFLITALVMALITLARPLPEPKRLPERQDVSLETSPVVKLAGAAVILGVAVFFIVFW